MADAPDVIERRARRYVEEVMTLDDVEAATELFAHPSELENTQPKEGWTLETYDDLVHYLTRAFAGFEDLSVDVDEVLSEGNSAMVRWELAGRLTEDLFGIPPTAKSFEVDGVTSFRFDEEARIVEVHDHVNMQEFMPDVARVARRGMVREMGDGVVVIDEDERIVDVNETGTETFDRERESLLDRDVSELLGEAPPAAEESSVVVDEDGRRHFEVDASALTGPGGDRLGRMLVFHEVTDRRRRVQQLSVLNRVLRHNLRNDLTVVKGVLDGVDEEAVEDPDLLWMARQKADDLLTTAETARNVRDTIENTATQSHDLATLVEALGDRAADRYPDADVRVSAPESVTVEGTTVLDEAVWELIENACQHGGDDPRVEVSVTARDETATLTIADDGPGLPDHERQALESGFERDLTHGSGLGLWLVYWAFDASGAEVTFAVEDGTTARATLPLVDEPA